MDSNYLNEVLTSEGSHLPNISFKISELMNQANILKNDFKKVVEHCSVQFTPLLKENNNLKLKSSNLLKDMMATQNQIDGEIKSELSSCAEELQTLSSSFKEVKLFLEILEQLLEINNIVRKARKKLEKKEFYECAELVTTVQSIVKNNSEKLAPVEIFRALSQEVILTYEQLMHQISEIWSQCVNIYISNDSGSNLTKICVVINSKSCDDLSQILKASHLLKSNLIERKFSYSLLNKILKKVILKKSNISSKVDDKAVLSIETFDDNNRPNYLEVFKNLEKIVNFLKTYLDFEIQDGLNFLLKLGTHIANEFVDCLIQNCLSETIPTSSDDLDKYKIVVENTEKFEKTLQEGGFLPVGTSSLLDYAKNINGLFANKFCQFYLHKARLIMKKDLYNVTESEDVISNISVLPLKFRNILKEKLNVQEDVFLFSKCQISYMKTKGLSLIKDLYSTFRNTMLNIKSRNSQKRLYCVFHGNNKEYLRILEPTNKQAEELMTLVHSIMKEIQKSLDLCAVRLFFTVRNIFEMYSAIVPLHHKKFLETLPHQVALFHNNCIYFTHNLINLTTEYYNKIPSILKDHFTILLEEAMVLRSLAAETLEVTVTNHRQQLIYILRDSGLAVLKENPKLDPSSEKSIRQCIRQLQILQTVWSDVLPLNIYNRAIGFLLDAVIEELISLIISVEDISSQTASDLVSCFTVVIDKTPSLFPESGEIHRHSRKWSKFKEFVLVLKGSLRDIDDRWANGMGPLAVEFTAEQVKHLIRALFQNSDRRAALLSRIR